MNTAETLTAARSLIAEPEHWTKGRSARDKNHAAVPVNSPDAVSFCAIGALVRVTGPGNFWTAERCLTTALGGTDVPRFNDDDLTSHSDVIALYDRAILVASNTEQDTP